jgi:hypothetical protein
VPISAINGNIRFPKGVQPGERRSSSQIQLMTKQLIATHQRPLGSSARRPSRATVADRSRWRFVFLVALEEKEGIVG